MKTMLLIAGRELKAYVRSPLGCIVAAAMLLGDGLWFQTQGLGAGEKLSAQILSEFFNGATGTTMLAAIFLSMRLIAQEREKNTLVLLNTSPVRETEIVIGKFVALFAFLTIVNAMTVYMPLLIFVHGKVSIGHILVGYAGVVLLGSAATAIGVFASALARTQVISVILAGVILGVMLLLWMVAKISDPPLNSFLAGLALHNERQRGFMNGILRLDNVFYYLVVTYVFLLCATKTLEARRWR